MTATGPLTPTLTRRAFLTATGGLVVYLAGCDTVQGSGSAARVRGRLSTGPWIAITEKNAVVVLVDKCEMGQGVRHMFASIVAEPLGLSPDAVQVEGAPVDAALYGNRHILPKLYGLSLGRLIKFQMTGRSSSTADMWDGDKLRDTAVDTRRLLLARAGERFGVAADQVELTAGRAVLRGDAARTASFAELVSDGRASASAAVPLGKPRAILGDVASSRRRIDARDKVTGRARFGVDVGPEELERDGLPATPLLVALVLRPNRSGDAIEV